MSLIPLEGLNEDTLNGLDTKPTSVGLRPFPCTPHGYTKQTACVLGADIKLIETMADSKEVIAVQICNGPYGGELLFDLSPTGSEAQKQRSLEARNKIIKILQAHTNGQLDDAKLKKAKGQCLQISAQHKGFRYGKDGQAYHKVALYLDGQVEDIVPVVEMEMPPLPDRTHTATHTYDDIPI